MVKRKRAALLPTNIALLQNLVRRDPASYKEEFLLQYRHYESLRDIFMANPASEEGATEFSELVGFVSQVCSCYPKETAVFPVELVKMLHEHHHELPGELREKMVQCLVMLRNKDVIESQYLIQSLFPLLISTSSKVMRSQIYSALVTLMKHSNTGTKNQKLNKQVQALLFNLLSDSESNGMWATKLTRELWRRGIWDDSRTVEIMTQAALSSNLKVASSAARFFLSSDKEREEAQEAPSSDEESFDLDALKHKMTVNKKTGRRGRKLEAAVKTVKKKNARISATYLNFSAIHLLRDPQGFAESLFSNNLSGKNCNKLDLEQKILFTNLVSRLVGVHKLILLGIYSFFLKYLTPKQRDVTQFMAAAAQSCHDLVPPESVTPMVKKIADEFVSDGVQAEVAAAGINTIREIASRAPLAIDADMLQDLTEYKGSKSKPVVMAARSLISLYRDIAPEMLNRKDRGKIATMEMSAGDRSDVRYGVETTNVTGIQGLDLLQKWKEEQAKSGEAGEENEEQGWEVASEGENSDDDGGDWVKVDSDKEYDVSDSEDEEGRPSKKLKVSKQEQIEADNNAFLEMASSRVLTPADFAKLDELKMEAGIEKIMGKPTKDLARNEDTVDVKTLIGPQKFKQIREERIAAAKEGKEGRDFSSRKGKIEGAHSTTNREKARKKNFMMMVHKKDVQGKAKRSLRDKQKSLRAHIEKQKKKGY
ncbi:hypothetical protein DV495_002691 [Geotrichum candidum]|nr:hypothetical protein DV452_003240 [Geotrichum candidum]KAF5116164.1 hypothetical protein DV454_001797 [Geotrichum candidum]KAF5128984.1 hypothetical protein DV495_002691 [Geotrichum candidum]KAI8134065.1 hypothetical protein DUD61_002280 [Geotrichum candidum]KAI9214349.1 hypothetical protein DS838_000727 [Geotrichum bryndzae]